MNVSSFSRKGLLILSITVTSALSWSNAAPAASVRLNWTDKSSTETGFKVERATSTTGSFSLIATLGANVQSYIDSSVTQGKTYCYRVRSYNSAGTSSPLNPTCVNVSSSTARTGGSRGGSNVISALTSMPASNITSTSTTTSTIQYGAKWSKYRFMVKMMSTDDDVIGVMFRFRNYDNYYRFLWSANTGLRRLEKRVNGRFFTLFEDAVRYVPAQTYQLEIIANGPNLQVKVDGTDIFFSVDSSLSTGTIALYSSYNPGSVFDDVLVQDLSSGTTLLMEDFNYGRADGWVIVDEGAEIGSSTWTVSNNVLVQSSNIGSSASKGWLGTYALYAN